MEIQALFVCHFPPQFQSTFRLPSSKKKRLLDEGAAVVGGAMYGEDQVGANFDQQVWMGYLLQPVLPTGVFCSQTSEICSMFVFCSDGQYF